MCNINTTRAAERELGHFALGPTLLMAPKDRYTLIEVKYSIKTVTTYILPWAPQALSAALNTTVEVSHLKLVDNIA